MPLATDNAGLWDAWNAEDSNHPQCTEAGPDQSFDLLSHFFTTARVLGVSITLLLS